MYESNSKVCRICLLGTSKGVISLFTVCNGVSKFKIFNKIMEVTDIEIHEGDELPKWICYTCLVHLETSYQFKLQAEKSDKLLKKQLGFDVHPPLSETVLMPSSTTIVGFKNIDKVQFLHDGILQDCSLEQCSDDNQNGLKITNVISQAEQTENEDFSTSGNGCACKGGNGPVCVTCATNNSSASSQEIEIPEVPTCTCTEDDNLKCGICMSNMVNSSMENILGKITRAEPEFIDVANCSLKTEKVAPTEPEFVDVDVSCDISMCTCSIESSVKCDSCLKAIVNSSMENMLVKMAGAVCQPEPEFIDVASCSSKTTPSEPEFVDVNAPCDVSMCTCSSENNMKCDACLKILDGASQLSIETTDVLQSHGVHEIRNCEDIEIAKQHVLDPNLECFMCNEIFQSWQSFNIHMLSHSELACLECGKTFLNKTGLKNHKLLHLDDKLRNKSDLECHICDKVFESKQSADEHIQSHSEVRLFKCLVCKFTSYSFKYIMQHRLKHREDPFTCRICLTVLESESTLEAHIMSHKIDGAYKCHLCDTSFTQENRLRCHIYLHLYKREFKCKYCDEVFVYRSYLAAHEVKHEEAVTCTVCDVMFKTKGGLQTHVAVHHSGSDYKCVCEICGKGFMRQSLLNSHKIIHNGRPVNCDICKKQVPHERALRKHKSRTHSKRIPVSYKCEMCEKSFKHVPSLKMHVRSVHSAEKYPCNICSATFTQPSALRTHEKIIHHGLEPHSCDNCGCTFKWKQTCDKHKLKCVKK